MEDNRILVFYNNKNYEIITIFTPNGINIDIDDFILSRIEYDDKCKDITAEDISYSIGSVIEYQNAIENFQNGWKITIDRLNKNVIIIGDSKNLISFDNIEQAYEFNLEYNIKALGDVCALEYLPSAVMTIGDIHTIEECIEYNDYFKTKTEQDLKDDIALNGMYFPLMGEWNEEAEFVVTEGMHRAIALKEIGGSVLCLYLIENTEEISLYSYLGNNSFEKKKYFSTESAMESFVQSNIKISNEIFIEPRIVSPYYMINNDIGIDRAHRINIVQENKKDYTITPEDAQDMYDKYLTNLSHFTIIELSVDEILDEETNLTRRNSVVNMDPFLYGIDEDEFKQELLTNGMYWPLIVYEREGLYYITEGYHRWKALLGTGTICKCIVMPKEDIYQTIPNYGEDFTKEMWIPKNVFPYNPYPYINYEVLDETFTLEKVIVKNNIQKIQAYKLIPMVMKYITNYIYLRYGEKILPGEMIVHD